jgi:hypothetical protein
MYIKFGIFCLFFLCHIGFSKISSQCARQAWRNSFTGAIAVTVIILATTSFILKY